MANDNEDDDDNEPQRRAVAAVLLRHRELQAFAAGRTRAAGLRMVLSSRARQRASMKPYVLSIGMRCRVSFLFSPTIRMHTKTALVGTYSPTNTPDVYRVTERSLAPGSRRVVLYSLETVAALQSGEQAPCRAGMLLVRLPVSLSGCDRRWLALAARVGRNAVIRTPPPRANVGADIDSPVRRGKAARRRGQWL